jgi:predicted ATP-binding protein involved in virulence
MRLKKIEINQYRNFKNLVLDFDKQDFSDVFTIASKNGGGKSTLIQFIFTLLHCFLDKDKEKYIRNILEGFSDIIKDTRITKFIIEDNGKEYELEFFIFKSNRKKLNLDLYLDLDDIKRSVKIKENENEIHKRILELKYNIENSSRVTPTIKLKLRKIKRYLTESGEYLEYKEAIKKDKISAYLELVEYLIKNRSKLRKSSLEMLNELKEIERITESKVSEIKNILEESQMKYIMHLTLNKNVLLLKTSMKDIDLKRLSNNIFLNAPVSQVFLFLSRGERQEIFNDFYREEYFYHNSLTEAKKTLNGFFNYDFIPDELILKTFKNSFDEDLKIKRETGQYGDEYDNLRNELSEFLDNKEIVENKDGTQIIFKIKDTQQILKPEDLSHGELKKLGIYIWLKYIVGEDAIVLMDEIDIALHPQWQYELVNELPKWSNSQYILATHSPQILSSTHYKNIIKLENGKAQRYSRPPVDRDINSIIVEVMEAPDFPNDLRQLHKKYRKLINKGEIDTAIAKILKEEILEYESENSTFFQEINFDLELEKM